jgi:cephalosporin-C deacetylase-like acetyl esterase
MSNQHLSLNRRDTIQLAGSAGLGVGLASLSGLDRATAADEDRFEPLNRFPRMVHNHYLDQVIRAERLGLRRKAALKTRQDAEAYVRRVQRQIRSCFAPFPSEKSPLNPQITGVLERDGYRVEKLIFESRPRFYVTANVYVPDGKGPRPAVVGTCGHSQNGKAAEAYQSFAQGLARMGYVCLIYDPIGQGERSQYLDEEKQLLLRGTTREHNMAGNQQVLIGEFLGGWRAWDGMRAVDYLLTREEVDGQQIGVTGNSGGGTMTTWLCGLEPRWSMAAPACFVTTWRRNMENEIPQDNEQCPPRSLAFALDHDDYLAAMAPKPVIILPKERDYFDVRGSEEVLQRLKPLYALLGAEKNIDLAAGPTTHGYSLENRESMYRWFNRVTGISDATSEPELIIEKDEDLWCTESGQVAELDSRTVFSFTRDRAKQLAEKREAMTGEALRSAVQQVLKMPRIEEPPRVRNLQPRQRDRGYLGGSSFMNYAVESEPGIQAIVTMLTDETWYSRPPRAAEDSDGRAILYVAHHSTDAELRNEPLVREVREAEGAGVRVFACDVRGVGESLPGTTRSDPHDYYGPDYFYAVYANMLDRPYVGGKTHDILRVLEWMESYGYDKVHVVAKGWGAVPATFAALLASQVRQVTLKNALNSFQEVATTEIYSWPLSTFPPGVLHSFDLTDCYAELAEKQLRQVDPLGADQQPD